MIATRGDVVAATTDTAGALADWRHALDIDPEASPLYATAFLQEREGRLRRPSAHGKPICDWVLARVYQLDTQWPERERERLLRDFHSEHTPIS